MIRILNKDLKFVDFLRKYTFSQYTEKFRGIGDFKILARIEENVYLLNKSEQFFVLFDDAHFGVLTSIKKESDSEFENTMELSGKMANVILDKRIVYRTIKFKGQTKDFVKTVIEDNMVNSTDSERNLPVTASFDDSFYSGRCMQINKSVTGDTVWNRLEPILEADNLGVRIIPHICVGGQEGALQGGIDTWNLAIMGGHDRTKGNSIGNAPVIFSQSYSNIKGTDYNINTNDYCNIAYIAGEGEGEERKWYKREINQIDSKGLTGWNRHELWIDARDIQSEDEEGNVLSDTEYETLINTRVDEKAEENTASELYESTIVSENKQYKYGVDYQLGDFVTVVDDELGFTIDVQVTEITVSEQDAEQIIDIGLTYGAIKKNIQDETKTLKQNTESNTNNIKYLENKIKQLEQNGTGGGGTSGGVTSGLYMFEIENGHLYYVYNEGSNPQSFEVGSDGHLYAIL